MYAWHQTKGSQATGPLIGKYRKYNLGSKRLVIAAVWDKQRSLWDFRRSTMMHCVAMQTKQKMAWMTKNTALPGSHVLTTWSTWNYRSINPCHFLFCLHSNTMQNSASTRRKGSDVERHGNKCTLTDANTDSQHLLYLKLLSSLQYSIHTSFSFFPTLSSAPGADALLPLQLWQPWPWGCRDDGNCSCNVAWSSQEGTA